MAKLIVSASLPLEGIEVMQDELMFVLGGAALAGGAGAGCGCGCEDGSGCGCGCNCIAGQGCGCGCATTTLDE